MLLLKKADKRGLLTATRTCHSTNRPLFAVSPR